MNSQVSRSGRKLARASIDGGVIRPHSIEAPGTKFETRGAYAPHDEIVAADQLAAIIIPFPRKVIARIAGVSPETVKAWRGGRQMPQTEHLFRLAKRIPAVRSWTMRMLGANESPEFLSPAVLTAMMGALHQVSHQKGPDGDAVRAALAQFYGARNGD